MPLVPDLVHRVERGHPFTDVIDEAAVYVALGDLWRRRPEEWVYASHEALVRALGVRSGTPIIVSGVGADADVEAWWGAADRPRLLREAKTLGITLLTVPNFSLPVNVVREDNQAAIKRIALCWSEAVSAGLPAALHLNARTPYDYDEWTAFIQAREEVQELAFEFATECGAAGRVAWHVRRLTALAAAIDRPLRLWIRGGRRQLGVLRKHFARVVLLDSDAYFKTIQRRRAAIGPSQSLAWRRETLQATESLDTLFRWNRAVVRQTYGHDAA